MLARGCSGDGGDGAHVDDVHDDVHDDDDATHMEWRTSPRKIRKRRGEYENTNKIVW